MTLPPSSPRSSPGPEARVAAGHGVAVVRRRGLLGAGVAVAATALVGCTPDPVPPRPTRSSTPTPPPATPAVDLPELDSVTFSELATALGGVKRDDTSGLIGSTAFVLGRVDREVMLKSFDTKAGTLLWEAPFRTHMDGLLPEGQSASGGVSGWGHEVPTLFVRVYVNPCPGNGAICHKSQTTKTEGWALLALDARTGKKRWLTTLLEPISRDDPKAELDLGAEVVGADDDVCVALIGPRQAISGRGRRPRVTETVAVDTRTGKKLWSATEFTAAIVAGGRVLGYRPFTTNAKGVGTIAMLDSRTGKPVPMAGLPDDVNGQWGDITSDHVFVRSGSSHHQPFVVELTSGRVVHTFDKKQSVLAVGSDVGGKGMLLCWRDLDLRGTTWTMAVGEPGPSPLGTNPWTAYVQRVHDGMIITGGGRDPSSLFDRSARPLGQGYPPGRVIAWEGDRMLFGPRSGDTLTLYGVAS